MIYLKKNLGIKYTVSATAILTSIILSACGNSENKDSLISDETKIPTVQEQQQTCQALQGKTFDSATVTKSTWIEANESLNSSAMCHILATRAPYLDIEVIVPSNWSGRYWQQGGGGFDGTIPSGLKVNNEGKLTAVNSEITNYGVVYAASNGGNRSIAVSADAPSVFFDGTADAEQSKKDYSYAAIDTTLHFAKGVIREFFAKDANYRYFNGCSNGGRNAYIAVQRWPNEFDGAVSGCFGMDIASQTMAWMNMANRVGTEDMPSSKQWEYISASAMNHCDINDNLADGIISNYNKCGFDVSALQCGKSSASSDLSECLTSGQLQTVQSLFGELKSSGKSIYSGFSWANLGPSAPNFAGLGSGYVALATGDSTWMDSAKAAMFDMDRDYNLVADGLNSAGANIDKNAIASYIASGRKLIHWHDSADALLSLHEHSKNVSLLHSMAKSMGLQNPENNSRYFVVPGTGHGGGKSAGWAEAIINWVEKDSAPTQLTYSSTKANGEVRSIPVCQYPLYPRYIDGDVNAASSFECTQP